MSSADVSQRPGEETGDTEARQGESGTSSKVPSIVRRGFDSGALAGLGGGLTLYRGVRAIRRGQWGRGLSRVLVGGLFVGIAVAQRRMRGGRSGVDQTDVVDTSPDVEHVDDAGIDQEEHATGEEAREVVEGSVDIKDVSGDSERSEKSGSRAGTQRYASDEDERSESSETASGGTASSESAGESGDAVAEATETEAQTEEARGDVETIDFEAQTGEPHQRIGEGTFDGHRGVPVPERVFEAAFLEPESDVFWGIRETDDAVFVSRRREPLEAGEGVEYVTTSRVDEEQLLTVPEVILDHWEGVGDDGVPVTDSDELVFATTEDLREVEQLRIVPEDQSEEVFEP